MPYKTSTHQYLISYKREGLHRDVEKHKVDHDNLKKMAESLGFRHDKQFIYNGLADFCRKKSAPEEKCEQL
ncbi:saxitoxin and tetrodotoxin-binding protein 2-like [Nothobranchius furzeri]|nr:saxitoxin and tetrodotoxin-binding protein 2-like [Nothobranchius furzeri]